MAHSFFTDWRGRASVVLLLPFLLGGCLGVNDFSNLAVEDERVWEQEFVVAVEAEANDLNVLSLAVPSRMRLLNTHEGLVGVDENFSIVSGLAVSWGRVNDTEWDFILRRGVRFQDGSAFSAEDVICSFALAQNNENSDLRGLLAGVEVKKVDDYTVQVKTASPDPLLLSKVAQVLIVPAGSQAEADWLVGTGPYRLVSHENGETVLEFFQNYWGGQPYLKQAKFVVMTESAARQEMAVTGECGEVRCGLLTAVPYSTLDRLSTDLQAYEFSNLGVTYLVFNYNSDVWSEGTGLQEALGKMMDSDEIDDLSGALARSASQFVSTGVFGQNPELNFFEPDLEGAKQVLPEEVRGQVLVLDYYPDFGSLADYLMEAWRELGVNVELNIVTSVEEMRARALAGQSDMYLMSWQVENGDAGDFFAQVAYSGGQFNWSGYENFQADSLLDLSAAEMDWQTRLEALREVSRLMVEGWYGLPLFESVGVYALRSDMYFVPRADGMVLLKNIEPLG